MKVLKQSGFIAVFTLIMLAGLTVVAVGSFNRSIVDEQMVGNLRDKAVSVQRTELALRAGETALENLEFAPVPKKGVDSMVWIIGEKAGSDLDTSQTSGEQEASELTDALLSKTSSWVLKKDQVWWESVAMNDPSAAESHFFIEEQAVKPNSLVMRNQYTSGRSATYYYRITARSKGETLGKTIVQTTYAKRFN